MRYLEGHPLSFFLSNEIGSSAGVEAFSPKALVQLSCTTKAGPKLLREPASQGAWSMPCMAAHIHVLQIPPVEPLLLLLGALLRAYVANACLYCLSEFKKGNLWIYLICSACHLGAALGFVEARGGVLLSIPLTFCSERGKWGHLWTMGGFSP